MSTTDHHAAASPSSASSELLDRLPHLHTEPAALGPMATARRKERCGTTITIRSAATLNAPAEAVIVRGTETVPAVHWPTAATLQPGDRLIVSVAATDDARQRYVTWLSNLDFPAGCTIAPHSTDDSGLHQLWTVAATRILADVSVGVEARHDLLGIRLAQLALAMGADTLSGPVQVDRSLPLAGVPRPTETTRDGLQALVRHAGLDPAWQPTATATTSSASSASAAQGTV